MHHLTRRGPPGGGNKQGKGADIPSAKPEPVRQREPFGGYVRGPFARVAIPQHRGPVLWDSTKEIEMRSSRSSFLAAVAAMAAMSAAGAAEVVRDASSQALMPPRAAEKVSGTANRRAPGAHKAAHRAAMKLRRVKKHKARCK